jgi:hypothetical protein
MRAKIAPQKGGKIHKFHIVSTGCFFLERLETSLAAWNSEQKGIAVFLDKK